MSSGLSVGLGAGLIGDWDRDRNAELDERAEESRADSWSWTADSC